MGLTLYLTSSYLFVVVALLSGYARDEPVFIKLSALILAPIGMVIIIAIDIAERYTSGRGSAE